MHLPSYPSPHAIGHKAIQDLFDGPVLVQEKIDGSQISFGVDDKGILSIRSKGASIEPESPPSLFGAGVNAIRKIQALLTPGYVYRGEYLSKPKHNVLAYDRMPRNHIALFDITIGHEVYASPEAILSEADRLGFEASPVYHSGLLDYTPVKAEVFLENISCLGGSKIEGFVVKNYAKFTIDHHVMMGKFVSDKFKEVHRGEWKKENPSINDIKDQIISDHRTPARWAKAVQHIKERGTITNSVKDIGPLVAEVVADVEKECKDEIMEKLYQHFIKDIKRGVVYGLPEWYKQELLNGE